MISYQNFLESGLNVPATLWSWFLYIFVAKYSSNSKIYEIENFLRTFAVTMATAAILKKKVNIPKVLTHEGCRFSEISFQKVQPSLRKMKLKNCAQWQWQPF
jgi:hypothetical protein